MEQGEAVKRMAKTTWTVFGMLMIGVTSVSTEELLVVRYPFEGISDFVSVDGINVYAVLEEGLLIGVSVEGGERIEIHSIPETVKHLGERDIGREYYVFRANPGDLDKFPPETEILYYDGNEAIAGMEIGAAADPRFQSIVMGLTRVSFTPKPIRAAREAAPTAGRRITPEIASIVDEVSEAQYTAYIQRLQDFVTRFSSTDSCRAAEEWAAATFEAMGLETELFPYIHNFNTWYDPVGRKTGTLYPDSIYMIVGHIDATSNDPLYLAPGAEDNGSGSACVLEAARVLSRYDFDCTIEFVLVSGEELGLIGSEAYARYCVNEGKNIAGVLNFDMIAYAGSHGWDTNIYADQFSPEEVSLADLLAQLTDEYSRAYSIRVDTDGPQHGSDHYYFSFYGYPAIFSIDAQLWGAPDWYPWYHSTSDVITNLDLDYATEVVKGSVAALATLANLSTPPLLEFDYLDGLPAIVDPGGGTTFRVDVTAGTAEPEPGTGMLHYDAGSGFTEVPMNSVGPNAYEVVFPPIDCASSVSFYVSAGTVGGETVTDPAGAPATVHSSESAIRYTAIYSDDFSTNRGWTGFGGPAEWTMGVAVGGRGEDTYGSPDPSSDHSPSSDNRLLGNDLTQADGDFEARITDTFWITSPPIDCRDYFGVTLSFYRWLGIGENRRDHAYIEVFDGSSWLEIYANPTMRLEEAAWKRVTYDVSSAADGNPAFRVRFGLGRTDWGFEYCGWNIDDLEIAGYSCLPPQDVSADLIPDDDPTIVSRGGSFGMTVNVTNNGAVSTTTDVWLGTYLGKRWIGRQLYSDVPIDPGETFQDHFLQIVPVNTPTGSYIYTEFCGDYETWTVADSSYFEVTVTE